MNVGRCPIGFVEHCRIRMLDFQPDSLNIIRYGSMVMVLLCYFQERCHSFLVPNVLCVSRLPPVSFYRTQFRNNSLEHRRQERGGEVGQCNGEGPTTAQLSVALWYWSQQIPHDSVKEHQKLYRSHYLTFVRRRNRDPCRALITLMKS